VFIFLLTLTHVNHAFAYGSYVQAPAGTTVNNNSVDITYTASGLDTFCYAINGDTFTNGIIGVAVQIVPDSEFPVFSSAQVSLPQYIKFQKNAGTGDIFDIHLNKTQTNAIYAIVPYCASIFDENSGYLLYASVDDYTFFAYPQYISDVRNPAYNNSPIFSFQMSNNHQNIWVGGSIFGSTTPATLVASVGSGVITTGTSIWPLLAFVGVGIAFVIVWLILDFIWYSIILGQTSKLTSKASWLDKAVYRPYKGYNRLRSRKWNLEHTLK